MQYEKGKEVTDEIIHFLDYKIKYLTSRIHYLEHFAFSNRNFNCPVDWCIDEYLGIQLQQRKYFLSPIVSELDVDRW